MPIIQPIISGGGSAPSKYNLLDRVKDDNNNEIGTVCGYHTDANNQKYAVVCLDAQYRLASGQWLSTTETVTDLAEYQNESVWDSTDTATSNCTKILDFATANGYTSSAVSHCRSKSFVIEETTYYGQLPTIVELTDVFRNRTVINTKDTSASQYSSLVVPSSKNTWSSTQMNQYYAWYYSSWGNSSTSQDKTKRDYMVIPILEIPIN